MKCPVCHNPVIPNVGGHNIAVHRDNLGQLCPATGEPTYITEEFPCKTHG